MHVLVLTPVYPYPGSPTEGLFNQHHAQALVAAGAEVTVILCKPRLPDGLARRWGPYKPLAGLPEHQHQNGIDIFTARYIHVPRYRMPVFTVRQCARAVERTLSKYHIKAFDIVQVHSVWPTGLAAPLIAKQHKKPLVVTLHIEDDPRLLNSPRGQKLYHRMIHQAGALVPVGTPLDLFMKDRFPESTGKLHIIPNGADFSTIDKVLSSTPPLRDDWGHIVSVANLWPVKGIDFNLRALGRLAQEGISWQSYTIVGDGPERQRLEALARALKIDDRVHFAGRLPHLEAMRTVFQADIFSLPSWQESFGVAYLEAMALSKPVIGCYGQGAEDIILQEQTGLLVSPKSIDELSAALKRLLDNPEWAHQIGESARHHARTYTWQRNAARYMALYEQLQ